MEVNIKNISDENRLRPELSEVNRLFGDNTLLKNLTIGTPSYTGREWLNKRFNEDN